MAKDRTNELLGVEDSPSAMMPVPVKKSEYETSKDDGVLLEGLDNLRKGLIILRDMEPSVHLQVGNKVFGGR